MQRLLLILFLLFATVANATVTTTINTVTYVGNSATTVFPFSFSYPGTSSTAASDFIVQTVVSGITTTLPTNTYTITFTAPISPNPTGAGGSVTYPLVGSPLVTGGTITITRTMPAVQSTSLADQSTLYPSVLEQAYDYITMLVQQINASANALLAPVTDPAGLNYTVPAVANRANRALCFDSVGNVIACVVPASGVISSAMQPVVSAATIAAAQTLLGITVGGSGTAPTTTYTAPGTGAVASNVQLRLVNELWASDFGAVCNSVTNDQVAFSNMIAAGVALGIGTHFTGRCAIATAIPINGTVSFEGSSKGTAILLVPVGQSAIILTGATYSRIEHMEIFGSLCAGTGGVFAIQANAHSDYITIDDLLISCTENGVGFSASGGFNITNTLIGLGNQSAIGVLIGTGTVDSANGRINNSIITNAATPPSTAIAVVCQSCAGLRFLNNDINGVFNIGLQVNAINVQDGDLLVAHNNIEGIYGSAVNIARTDVVSFFGDFSFVNNEFSGPQCFVINGDATGPWILAVNIVGNICNGASTTPAWFINSVWGLTFTGNTTWVATGVADAFIGSLVNYAVLGPNICIANPVSNANKYTAASACAANTNNATNSTVFTPY